MVAVSIRLLPTYLKAFIFARLGLALDEPLHFILGGMEQDLPENDARQSVVGGLKWYRTSSPPLEAEDNPSLP